MRCRATEEMVDAINIVKMYCWESAFLEKIINSRQEEIFLIKQKYYLGHIWQRLLGSFEIVSHRYLCYLFYNNFYQRIQGKDEMHI